MPCFSIVDMHEVVRQLYNKKIGEHLVIDDTIKDALDSYYEKYGAEKS